MNPTAIRRLVVSLAVGFWALEHPTAAAADDDGPGAAPESTLFELDPVMDGAIVGSGFVLGLTLEFILHTGELAPQPPGDPDKLLGIDRWRATDTETSPPGLSNIGRGIIVAYTLGDSVLVDLLDRGDPWYHYVVIYLQSWGITLALTDITKIAVRRPRPIAYHEVQETGMAGVTTDRAVSFFSGHASVSAALAATATYFAFTRPASALERWLVFVGGLGVVTLVSVQRVLEGRHFPTDVIAGVAVGGAVGTIVPHLHRAEDPDPATPRVSVWHDRDASGLTLRARF